MALVSIEPSEVGATGLLWLGLTYGYLLSIAANFIGEGSDLLLLIPSLAGLVGGVVIPLLGAVPDGAIMLFSGLGPIEDAQEQLAVGVGALAGSTIMLLTIPLGLSVYYGRVNISETTGRCIYTKSPKLVEPMNMMDKLHKTGVTVKPEIMQAALIMIITTAPYLLIQIPAMLIEGDIALGEHNWAILAFAVCITGFAVYMYLQVKESASGQNQEKTTQTMKKLIQMGQVSLGGTLAGIIQTCPNTPSIKYGSLPFAPPAEVAKILESLLKEPFEKFDEDNNKSLDKSEVRAMFAALGYALDSTGLEDMFVTYDVDKSGCLSFEELVCAAYHSIKAELDRGDVDTTRADSKSFYSTDMNVPEGEDGDEEDEVEDEVPEELANLPADQQEQAIKMKAFKYLIIGTVLVVVFSDPMVDVLSEVAVRTNVPKFYVSFVLAPVASNTSELFASIYYARKKTTKSMSLSISTLLGAATMNNTFCLAIFMAIIFARGLAWQYTAETIVIVVTQIIVGYICRSTPLTLAKGCVIFSLFPLSLIAVYVLEAIGFD